MNFIENSDYLPSLAVDALELAADLSDLAVEARELTAVLAPVELATVLTLARLSVSPSPIVAEAACAVSERRRSRPRGPIDWARERRRCMVNARSSRVVVRINTAMKH